MLLERYENARKLTSGLLPGSTQMLLTFCSLMEAIRRYGGYERAQVCEHQVGLF